MKPFNNPIWLSARESVYLVAVSLLLLKTGKTTMDDIDVWLVFTIAFFMLLDSMAKTLKDTSLFRWDKIVYLFLATFAIITTGIRAFFGKIEMLGIITLALAGALCVYMLAEGIIYQIQKSRHTWRLPIPFGEAVRLWFANNIAYISLMLALYRSLTL